MRAYSIVLFIHLLALLLAAMAASVAFYAALQLRKAVSPLDATRWGRLEAAVVPAFPVAAVSLFASGAYMTQAQWTWHTGWIDAGIAGLALIVACGSGVEATRGRALKRELTTAGMSARARRLLADPYAWSAKMITLTVTVGVVFVMSTKPGALASAATITVAVAIGIFAAIPFWLGSRTPGHAQAADLARSETT